jgi:hypothetical protein
MNNAYYLPTGRWSGTNPSMGGTPGKETPLDKFKDNLSTGAFGVTKEEVSRNICISCKQPVDIEGLEDVDRAEFKISRVCPKCFDSITEE